MKNTDMLKKNYEFKNILNNGKYYSARNLQAFIVKNNQDSLLLGIAISSKIANAVNRNKIKRYIRESYREIEDCLKLGNSIVILCKKNAKIDEMNYKNIKSDIKYIMKNAGILEDES